MLHDGAISHVGREERALSAYRAAAELRRCGVFIAEPRLQVELPVIILLANDIGGTYPSKGSIVRLILLLLAVTIVVVIIVKNSWHHILLEWMDLVLTFSALGAFNFVEDCSQWIIEIIVAFAAHIVQ